MKKIEAKKRVVHPADVINQTNAREHSIKNRPIRVPLYKQTIIDLPKRPGYVNRFVLDKPGRIEAFLKAGWSLIQRPDAITHDGTQTVESQMGSAISRVLNQNADVEGRVGYGMEIPEEFYKEDQARKIEQIEKNFKESQVTHAVGMYGQEFSSKIKDHG